METNLHKNQDNQFKYPILVLQVTYKIISMDVLELSIEKQVAVPKQGAIL